MYEELNGFLRHETWYSGHDYDEQRFYQALSKIVRLEGFNADQMGEYIRDKKNVATRDGSHPFEAVIDELILKAHAVRDYLRTTRE